MINVNADVKLAERYTGKATSAKSNGHEFDLSFSEYKRLMNQKRCAYSGREFSEYEDGKLISPQFGRTLDRIDNSLGYVKGNVVVVCYGVNQFKSQLENPNNFIDVDIAFKILQNIKKFNKG